MCKGYKKTLQVSTALLTAVVSDRYADVVHKNNLTAKLYHQGSFTVAVVVDDAQNEAVGVSKVNLDVDDYKASRGQRIAASRAVRNYQYDYNRGGW